MLAQANIPGLEDEILNTLNDILLLSYGTGSYRMVEEGVSQIVAVLEQEHLIHKRLGVKQVWLQRRPGNPRPAKSEFIRVDC